MTHIKKYWIWYLVILVLLILVGIQLKWFGNKTTLFAYGGTINSGSSLRKPNCKAGEASDWTHGPGVFGWLGWTGSWSKCHAV